MIVVDLLQWKLNVPMYSKWCAENKIPVLRVSMTKFKMKEADYVFFKMKFTKQDYSVFKVNCDE
jgi:hypothetical protein